MIQTCLQGWAHIKEALQKEFPSMLVLVRTPVITPGIVSITFQHEASKQRQCCQITVLKCLVENLQSAEVIFQVYRKKSVPCHCSTSDNYVSWQAIINSQCKKDPMERFLSPNPYGHLLGKHFFNVFTLLALSDFFF